MYIYKSIQISFQNLSIIDILNFPRNHSRLFSILFLHCWIICHATIWSFDPKHVVNGSHFPPNVSDIKGYTQWKFLNSWIRDRRLLRRMQRMLWLEGSNVKVGQKTLRSVTCEISECSESETPNARTALRCDVLYTAWKIIWWWYRIS